MDVPYEELDPGIRQVVRWLNDNGFYTTDSGDGVTKFEADEPMCCAMPFPNVAIQTSAAQLIDECNRLTSLLADQGVQVEPLGPEEVVTVVSLQGFYDPTISTENGYITLMGLDDKRLA